MQHISGNVVVLPSLSFAADTSALLDHEPNIQGESNLVTVLGQLSEVRPCVGHWHADTAEGTVTFGPAMNDAQRSVAIYVDESDKEAVLAILDAFQTAGGTPKFDFVLDWKAQLYEQEMERLPNNLQTVAGVLMKIKSPMFLMSMLARGVDPEDVRKAIIAGNGDVEATKAALDRIISEATAGADEVPDGGFVAVMIGGDGLEVELNV